MAHGRWESLTIANGAATSTDVQLAPGERIALVEIPSAWTAADIGIDVARDGTNYLPLKIADGTAIARLASIPTGAAELRIFDFANIGGLGATFPWLILGPNLVRLRSVNTASTADLNQGAARTLRLYIIKD